MIILLYGKDTYRLHQKLREIIEHYKELHKKALSLKSFDFEKESFESFRDEIKNIPLFKEKKLIILKNVFSDSESREAFLDFFKKNREIDDTIVFYEEGDLDPKNALFRFLKQEAKTQEFKLLNDHELRKWLRKGLEKCSANIDFEAESLLIHYIGNDLWRFSNELKKLLSFTKKISQEEIKLLVKPKIESNIFGTIDAIAQGNKKKALKLIHQHLELGDSPLYLLVMISFQFRNLLMIKDLIEKNITYAAILKKTKLHPFVVKKSYNQAERFSIEQLKKIYQQISEIDLAIKTGKIKPELALDTFITEI